MAKACNSCKDDTAMVTMSSANYEANEARHERREKRLVIALIISIFLTFACNCVWLYAWLQYDYSSEETVYQQDGKGTNIIGDSNEVNNGTETDNTQTQEN